MFGNNMVTCLSITGMVIVALGTVMGIIGMASSDWFLVSLGSDPKRPIDFTHPAYLANFKDSELVNSTTMACRIGLWQTCCTPLGMRGLADCTSETRTVTSDVRSLRSLMVVSVILLIFSVIVLVFYSFKQNCHSCYGNRICVSFLASISVLCYLLVTMAVVLSEYSSESGLFKLEGADLLTLTWSFFVALVGGLLNPLGLFLLCTQWHITDDNEAGVDGDYDAKPVMTNNNAFDTYI